MALGGGADLVQGGRAAGEAWVAEFTTRCYHQPCDLWSPAQDWRGPAEDVGLTFEVGRALANSAEWPAWRDGSEFRAVRDRTAAERR